MARLIDADKAVEYMNQVETDSPFDDKEDILEKCVNILDLCPTVDAVPVVRGEWISLTDCANAGVYCSVCHKKVWKEDYAWCNRKNKLRSNYCPNCGADMRGAEDGK